VGTADQIKGHVRKLINDAGKGGGCIMMNSAAIDDVPPQNVKAMIDAIREFGVH